MHWWLLTSVLSPFFRSQSLTYPLPYLVPAPLAALGSMSRSEPGSRAGFAGSDHRRSSTRNRLRALSLCPLPCWASDAALTVVRSLARSMPAMCPRLVPRTREMPACTTNTSSSMMVHRGRRAKTSWILSYRVTEPYLDMTSSKNPYARPMCSSSWLPLLSSTWSGTAALRAKRVAITSTPLSPLSTKSPLKTKVLPGPGQPRSWNIRNRSLRLPWMSPTTVMLWFLGMTTMLGESRSSGATRSRICWKESTCSR
mmetsp:Transcript_58102/g.140064  ORF Transcript_58102/g.140064 Transcript_58102/m.140064 type:complete len:255 (-) Transcript_58102:26-790(-)